MTLLGLSLAQLGAIFGALGGAVTLLYVLKLRRRRVHVPFAKLWERVLREKESTSLFRRLKRLLSLLVQLAFLLLLTGALGDPRLSEEILEGRQIILLLDTSASMKAKDGAQGSRIASAIAEARRIIGGLGGADSLMIVRMDAQVTPLSSFTGDEKLLLKVLSRIEAADTRADLARALKFCGDALRDRNNPLLILVGDGAYDDNVLAAVRAGPRRPAPPSGSAAKSAGDSGSKAKSPKPKSGAPAALDRIDLRGIDVRFVPVGRARRNIGIVAFSARRYPTNKLSFEVFLEVVHHAGSAERDGSSAAPAPKPAGGKPSTDAKPVDVDLQLLADGVVTEVQRLSLRPGERARFSCGPEERRQKRRWCEMAASGELLEARLVPAGSTGRSGDVKPLDAFPLDDQAYALLPKRRKQKVLLVSTGNLFLEGAMLLDDNIEYTRIDPGAYSKAALRGMDAVVFDSFYPDEEPGVDTLLLAPPPDLAQKTFKSPFPVRGLLDRPLVTEQSESHPVMRWITLKDINIAMSAAFRKRPGDTVLAASFRTPIIIARDDGRRRTVALGFDPRRSDLPLRVAFPIMIINTFHWFSGDSDELVTTYKTGETWRVPLSELGEPDLASAAAVTVIDPDRQRSTAPIHDGRAVLHGNRVGVYRIEFGDAGRQLRLVANLADSEESRIQPRRTLVLGGRKLEPPSGFGVALRREIWIYLLLVAIGITLVEWLTYNRRVTV